MVRLLVNRRVLGFAAVVAGLLTVVLWPTAVQVDVAAVSTADGTRVILHPGDTLVDGSRVRERTAPK